MKLRLYLLFIPLFLLTNFYSQATTDKYRCVWRADPATTMTIGFNQVDSDNPVVFYDVVDYGQNATSYSFSKIEDRAVSSKSMDNRFVRLTGLLPNTTYYFVVKDDNSTSQRFYFKTAPDDPTERLSFIAGGDSRSNPDARRRANRLVAKLKVLGVFFGGDMTEFDTFLEWPGWFDDWQLTNGSDGRMTPIVAARGNHEFFNASIHDLFDTPNEENYFALTFGGDLLRTYTLNSLISVSGDQRDWLEADLIANPNLTWKMAQYHYPTRPHISEKSEQDAQRTDWSTLFDQHNVRLVIECDAHVCKTTWPIRVSTDAGSDEGFIRDDANGTVYMGEGCWGAPIRSIDDEKTWTRNAGSFNQFKWIFIDQHKIEARTIKIDNVDDVGEVDINNPFEMPANIDIWVPNSGGVVIIKNADFEGEPDVRLVNPIDQSLYANLNPINLKALASDTDGSITKVEFLVNERVVGEATSAPYQFAWTPTEAGLYHVAARAIDNDGNCDYSFAKINVFSANVTVNAQIEQYGDDAEESTMFLTNGTVDLESADIELADDGVFDPGQHIGFRFNNLHIPPNATITNAYIQFTADETTSGSCNLQIRAELSPNARTFLVEDSNISSRPTTSGNPVYWTPLAWNTANAATANEQTPNLAPLIQQVIAQNDWRSGNSMAFIITGDGERKTYAYDSSPSQAASLHIEYAVTFPPITAPFLGDNPLVLCGTETTTLDAGSGYTSYFWNYNHLGGQNQFYDVLMAGLYNVQVMDSYGQVANAEIMINQQDNPILDLGFTDTTICSGCTLVLDAGEHAEYLWNTNETTQTITINETGTYGVFVVDEFGCNAFVEVNVTVMTDVTDITAIRYQVKHFPNPTSNILNLSYTLAESNTVEWRLFNSIGQEMLYSPKITTAEGKHMEQLSVHDLSEGMYFLQLNIGEDRVIKKILVGR